MSDDLESCRKMQLMYLQRAKSDPPQTVSGSNGPSGGPSTRGERKHGFRIREVRDNR